MLSISGDHQTFGTQKNAKKVYDIDSIQLISLVKRLRDEKKMLGDEDLIQGDVQMFIGAAANPLAPPAEFRAFHLQKKIDAGADFIQTQSLFNLEKFREWMKIVCDMGLDKRSYILAGLIPLKSLDMAKYMAEKVPGISIPESILKRIGGVPKGESCRRRHCNFMRVN